ncbi:MAG: HD domain-containing protein [Oscillospiraceae bacterium]|nr:HD domain-containing protein [Oscillospiraceae bacterium]
MRSNEPDLKQTGGSWKWQTILCLAGLLINLGGARLAERLDLPLFLDTTGTVLTAVLGGYLPCILVGLLTNLIKGLWDFNAVYFGGVNVLVGVCSAFFAGRSSLNRISRVILFVLAVSIAGGLLSAVLTWFLYGFGVERSSRALTLLLRDIGITNNSAAQILADLLINLVDKALTIVLALFLTEKFPEETKEKLHFKGWRQNPLSAEAEREAQHSVCRSVSLTKKIAVLITAVCVCVAAGSSAVTLVLYYRSAIEEHTKRAQGVAALAAAVIDPEQVDNYLTLGEQAAGYLETQEMLYMIRESSPDILYVYAYRILPDGVHVVFDLDTEDLEGSEPGEVFDFDLSFVPLLPALFAGETIDPIISDDSYGWLLTVYQPVYDSDGNCQCYAAADISMSQLRSDEYSFAIKILALFLGFFTLILAAALWVGRYNVILPLNSMAMASSAFAYDSEQARSHSVERLHSLGIRTGDEIENLYLALLKTTQDSMEYVDDIHRKTDTITRMQSGLILVLADLVESRDKCTGDHVRKTADYARIIMNELRREGMYPLELTDEFINNVYSSAPLHDIGKIKVSDTILNKPGRLTDEEFEEMKNHTTAGSEIISQAIALVSDSTYLNVAKDLAKYHHERWDGKGYPCGLSEEAIPLSARIMAVADVFDALISKRSYKEGMPFETAVGIIREGSGTHFDPKVVRAFLNAEREVRQVAEQFAAIRNLGGSTNPGTI